MGQGNGLNTYGAFYIGSGTGFGFNYNLNSASHFDASRSSSVYQDGLNEARVKNVSLLPILKY